MVETIFTMLGAGMIGYSGYGITQAIKQVRSEFKITREEEYRRIIEEPELNEWHLSFGFKDFGGYKRPIMADMRYNPHVLVAGLARQGKTKMVEHAIQGKNVILMNTDIENDFQSIKAERINDFKECEAVLRKLVEIQRNNQVTYVVIDEILALIKSGNGKSIMDLLTQLLATGSHKNIYVIALTQDAEKKLVENKNLFNCRICFKMLDESSYKVVLGEIPESLYISRREFYYVTDSRGRGYTYDI